MQLRLPLFLWRLEEVVRGDARSHAHWLHGGLWTSLQKAESGQVKSRQCSVKDRKLAQDSKDTGLGQMSNPSQS